MRFGWTIHSFLVLGALAAHPAPPPLVAAPARALCGTDEPVDPEQAYVDALRERKLYRLLEVYCRRQLERSDASAAERARYTIELANILATHAGEQVQSARRAELWGQASALLRAFLDSNAQHPQAITLEFQLGVYELAQGELVRQQSKLAPAQRELVESARAHLHAAIRSFRKVESDMQQAMKKRSPAEGLDDQPTGKQLLTLSTNTRYRLGQALLALAQTYPRHSADQTDAAAQAKTQFEAFTQRYSTSELTLESYLGRAECLRLLGDAVEAGRVLADLTKPGTPEKYLDRALVLRAQIQVDQKKPAAARNFIDDARKLLKAPNPDLDLLYVQALLELAREQSKGQSNLVARQLVSSALEEIDRIEKRHGLYWVSRCELLLAELAAEKVLVEDPAVLVRMADGQYRRGDRLGTVATLDRAITLAAERGDANATVDLGFRAASIQVQQKDYSDAARRFARLASTYPNHTRAPESQYMVAYCHGQIFDAEPSAERLDAYERSLDQMIATFGAHPAAVEARWLLGSLRARQRRWPDAIELWRAIPRGHNRSAAARAELGRLYELWLADLWARSEPSERVAADAIQFFREALPANRNAALAQSDVPLALAFARILAHPTVGRFAEAEEIAELILFGRSASEAQRSEARRVNVDALLGQDKFDDAKKMIETEFVGVPQELFAVVQSLEESAGRSPETRRRQMGKLQLAATERLVKDAEQLSAEQSLQAEIYLALAYVNAAEAARADEIFAKLHDRVADNPRVLEAQAECFMQLGRFARARDLWRQLLALVPDNSPAWYRAKYQLALACFLSNDAKQALKIIQVTELLHPDLGGPEMKAKFDELKSKTQPR